MMEILPSHEFPIDFYGNFCLSMDYHEFHGKFNCNFSPVIYFHGFHGNSVEIFASIDFMAPNLMEISVTIKGC